MDASHFDRGTAYAALNRFRLDDLHPYIYRTHDGGQSWQKITNGLPDDAPRKYSPGGSATQGSSLCRTEHNGVRLFRRWR